MAEYINVSDNLTDSSDYAFITSSITHSKSNKFTLDSLSTFYKINDEIVIGVYDILKKYEHILKSNVVEIEIPEDFLYKPEYVSKYYYNTTDLWYLIMFLNNITDVYELNKTTVKVLNIDNISILNEIYAREFNNLNTSKNPKDIEIKLCKELDKKSDFIFKENTVVYKPLIPPETKIKSYVIKDFINNFEPNSKNILLEKIKRTYYNRLIDGTFSKTNSELSNDISISDISKITLPSLWKSNHKIEFEGLFKAEEDGIFSFKPNFIGDCNFYINNILVKKFNPVDYNGLPNIYESYNSNYDFNLKSDKYWSYDNGTFHYDSILNKNICKHEVTNEFFDKEPVISTSIKDKYFNKNKKDFIVKTKIKTIDKGNLKFGSPKVTVLYTDGTYDEYMNESNEFTNNSGNYIDIFIFFSLKSNKFLDEIKVSFDLYPKDNTIPTSGEIYISELSIMQYDSDYVNIYLKNNSWNTFKIEYINLLNDSNYFDFLMKKPSDFDYFEMDKQILSVLDEEELNSNLEESVWNIIGNNVTLLKSNLGFDSYCSNNFNHLDIYNIKCNIKLNNLEYNGSIGIIFRKRSDDEYYLYLISKLNEKPGIPKSYLCGLYKVSPSLSSQPISSEEYYKLDIKLLSQTSQKYDESKDNLLFIQLVDNRIRVYNNYTGGSNSLIDYLDTSDPYLEGDFGFCVFNNKQVDFKDINVEYFPSN